jgi:hypothetical protein
VIKRICKWLCLLALATTPWTALPAKPQPRQQRIVAVGDLHGDFDAWREIALKARIINPRNRWAGGSTILVQAGDIADRGPDTLKIITHLMKLQREAARAGGRVVVLVGNHEAMNMTGDLRYVTPGEYAAFANANSARLRDSTYEANKATILAAFRAQSPAMTDDAIRAAWLAQNPLGKLEHQAAWSARGPLGKWTIANPAVARIGDSIFVHGGISVRYAAVPLDDINRRVATALAAHDDSPASILYDPFGPLWYRGLVTRKPDPANPAEPSPATIPGYPSIDDELAAVLRAQGAGRLVIAHTPRLAGIEVSHGGRLVRIDTGISRYYGGKLSYLEIVNGQVVPHNFDRAPAPAR